MLELALVCTDRRMLTALQPVPGSISAERRAVTNAFRAGPKSVRSTSIKHLGGRGNVAQSHEQITFSTSQARTSPAETSVSPQYVYHGLIWTNVPREVTCAQRLL